MNHTKQVRILLPLIAIILAVLACSTDEEMGTLVVGSTPVPFTARGETDHYWQAEVVPGAEYEVVIERNIPILMNVIDSEGILLTHGSFYDMTVTPSLTFTGPDDGVVRIVVSPVHDEIGRDLGTFTIHLQEYKP